ncbi:alpha-ribazole kinase [Natranaerobius trueperi]|uniref:Alpha-ribazole kinase n=1 Tax=Natranaerobius trueperi TaxID=759412 RepID=A0A226BXP1_9FIRM|nr:alpha-ribazole kinase [Natranaerobius trueperi]OWZ82969.1 alpha-ribazole kinase [Natranaerobius trueperi]
MITEVGDVKLIELTKEYLAVSCDSLGAIGEKKLDKVKVPTEWVGRVLSRVALMELIALRINPMLVVNTLSNELEPTGNKIITGIKRELKTIDLDPNTSLTGSFEYNILTEETAAGVTALGTIKKYPELGLGYEGMNFYLLGIPKVGNEVNLQDEDLADLPSVNELSKISEVKEIIPVGSKGIRAEAKVLANRSNLIPKFLKNVSEDLLIKSAGPSTCVIFTTDNDGIQIVRELANTYNKPVLHLGQFVKEF